MAFVSIRPLTENLDHFSVNHIFCTVLLSGLLMSCPPKTIFINIFTIFYGYGKSIWVIQQGCVHNICLCIINIFFLQVQSKHKITVCLPAMPVAVFATSMPNASLLKRHRLHLLLLFLCHFELQRNNYSILLTSGWAQMFFLDSHQSVFIGEYKMPPCSLPWYVFWWFFKDYKCTSISFSEVSKSQRTYLPLQDVKKIIIKKICIDPAGLSGLCELVLTISTARALTSP